MVWREVSGIESDGNKSVFRRMLNRILGILARILPGATTLRPFLHGLRGVQIEGRIFIGDDVYLENEYPECIELHDGSQICVRSILLAHTRGPGRIVVKRDAFVGAASVLVASPGRSLTIGRGAVVTTSSVVTTNVPDRALVGIEKARVLAEVTVPLKLNTSFEDFVAGLRPFKRE